MIVNRSSVVCVAGVLANKSSSVSSAMWSTVFSLAAASSEQDREGSKKKKMVQPLFYESQYLSYICMSLAIKINLTQLCT